ncbi:MAG: tetratricopeptide repeat protein [Bacteroidota bacterium]
MLNVRNLSLLFLLMLPAAYSFAQQGNSSIREGNAQYLDENFEDAELNYREALEANSQDPRALYNLGNALYKLGRYDEAANIFDGLSKLDIPENMLADAYHNLGNAQLGQQKINESVEAYKNSLRLRPTDNDTRHNLAYAMRMQQQEQQEQQQQEDQQDQEEQQQDDQQQQQDQQPQDQDQEEQQQQQQPRPDQISPEDAERILDAMNQKEQEIQQEIEREQRKIQPNRPTREW